MNFQTFHAGVAKVKTTPPLGTRINGDFVTHYANFIHDDLYAKAFVLRSGEVTVAIVVVDICVMPQDFLDDVKRTIKAQTGILFHNILISSTHTHAAGSVIDVHLGGVDLAYRKKLPGLIAESVHLALQNLVPAKIGFGAVQAPEHLVCRRYAMKEGYVQINPVTGKPDQVKTNPAGGESYIDYRIAPTDPEVGYLAIQDLSGKWMGLLANYSLHYVGDWENGTISADYFGVFSDQVREKLEAGDDFVAMMSNGTSGDVNIWDFLEPERYPTIYFEKEKLIGTALAEKVVNAIGAINWQVDPQLSVLYDEIPLKVVKPSADELAAAEQIVASSTYEGMVVDEAGLPKIYAREQVLLNEFEDQQNCPVQAIKIGNGVIGALAGEFFSETGLWLKEKVEVAHYFSISLANGNVGYVPPAAEMEKGGYETWRCRYSCLEPDAEHIVRERLLELIKAV